MKYHGHIDINRPQHIVANVFANPENNQYYQDGFLKKVLISGQAGEDGAVSKLYYRFRDRDMELTETITSNQLPDSFEAFYHHPHMDNTMHCRFIPIDANTTRYEYAFEYTRVSWVIPKLLTILFPGMFRTQGEKWIRQFKQFAETLEPGKES